MTYVIVDTNFWLSQPNFFVDYEIIANARIVLLKCVLKEIDMLKNRENDGFKARAASRIFLEWCESKTRTNAGWEINEHCEFIIDETTELDIKGRRGVYSPVDDQIIDCAEIYLSKYGKDEVILATQDRNMMIRAKNRNIPILNPSKWFQRGENQFFAPKLTDLLSWSNDGRSSLSLPVNISGELIGNLELWPFLGHLSGEFSTLHIRFFEQNMKESAPVSLSSPVIILSTDPRLLVPVENYYKSHPAFRQINTPYWAYHAVSGREIILPYKSHIIQIRVCNVELQKRQGFGSQLECADVFGYPGKLSPYYTEAGMESATDILVPFTHTALVFQSLGVSIKIIRSNNADKPSGFFATNISDYLPPEEKKAETVPAPREDNQKTESSEEIEKTIQQAPLVRPRSGINDLLLTFIIFFVCSLPYICLIAAVLIDFLKFLLQG
jgi:rRNA-processing protein FCF1